MKEKHPRLHTPQTAEKRNNSPEKNPGKLANLLKLNPLKYQTLDQAHSPAHGKYTFQKKEKPLEP